MWNSETWWMLLWLVLNAPLYLLIGRIVFGTWKGFFEEWSEARHNRIDLIDMRFLIFFFWVIGVLAAEHRLYSWFWNR